MSKPSTSQHALQAPTGTRDFYPAELNRLRYIQKAWRDVSIRHGFEEIDGPTFEHLDLYTIKSGEGIVSELFSFERHGGEKTYALRPEFTPTLARMYAAKANALPKPTKWFWAQNCYRAERPQRGRLREFAQWNVDFIGGEDPIQADAEVLICLIDLLSELGLSAQDCTVRVGSRPIVEAIARARGFLAEHLTKVFDLIDEIHKVTPDQFKMRAVQLGLNVDQMLQIRSAVLSSPNFYKPPDEGSEAQIATGANEFVKGLIGLADQVALESASLALSDLRRLFEIVSDAGYANWLVLDLSIARGLAYYTGSVFEVVASGERAIAGGGRYDNLIELFGGPPTPAVGFGMGDVVLSLVLQDKGLMPSDDEIATTLGLRPDLFVISSGAEAADAAVTPLVARLRREGLHARRSYKTTKNIGKLLKDAASANARFAAIIEPDGLTATVKNLDTGEQGAPVALDQVGAAVGLR